MNPQDLFARRVVQRLNQGLDENPHHIQVRLTFAREQALAAAKRAQPVNLGGSVLGLQWAQHRQRAALGVLALLAAFMLMTAQYRLIHSTAMEAADIDEIILSDDAPVQSYTDPGFGAVFRSGLLNPVKLP